MDNLRDPKGKFTTKKKLLWKENVSNSARRRKLNNEERKKKEGCIFDGRRIIEISQLAKDLWCVFCQQPISLRYIEKEILVGLSCQLLVRCQICLSLIPVDTNKASYKRSDLVKAMYDVNMKASTAVIDSGIGVTQFNTILSALNIPPTNNHILKKCEREVGNVIESVAHESCIEGIRMEKELTNRLTDDGKEDTVQIQACYDGAWGTCGNGHTYNRLSGQGSLIGRNSGKKIAYATRNKNCRQCRLGKSTEEHDCRKNWTGSAKAMEPHIAVSLVAKNKDLENENVIVGTLIGDDQQLYFIHVDFRNNICLVF